MKSSRGFLIRNSWPRALCGLLSLVFVLLLVSPAVGGPNADGVIILHRNDALVYTDDTAFCGQSGLNLCDSATVRADTGDIVILHVLAAFPGDGHPRLAGVTFGLDYDEAQTVIVDYEMCGDFELHLEDWPAPHSGSAVTWFPAQTQHLIEFYWFAAYSYDGNPAQLGLKGHSNGGGNFADDDVPSNLDAIADYGAFGFYMEGELPCPEPPPGTATLDLVPSEITVYQPCGSSFGVDLFVNEVYHLGSFEVCLGYDPSFLELDEVLIDSAFLGSTGREVYPVTPTSCDPVCQPAGIRFGAFTGGSEEAPSGSGRLATVRFSPQGAGSGTDDLCLDSWELTDVEIPPHDLPVAEVSGLSITQSPYCYGDFTGDGDVTVFDLAQIIPRWRCCSEDDCYSSVFDVNLLERGEFCASAADGCIDVVDIQSVAGRWHLGCPGALLETEASAMPSMRGAEPAVRISPEQSLVAAYLGDTTSVSVVVDDVLDLGGFEAGLSFDPAIVHVQSVEMGNFPGSTGRTVYALTAQIDNDAGTVHFGACSAGLDAGPDGSGVLARVIFTVEACGATTDLELTDVIVTEVDGWPLELDSVTGGSLEIDCAADAPEGDARVDYVLFPPQPNPASSTTEFLFSLPAVAGDGAQAQLDIFNASGRRIQRLFDRDLGPGTHRVVWDGRDESGERLPSGTYFCRLTFDGRVKTTQVQLVK